MHGTENPTDPMPHPCLPQGPLEDQKGWPKPLREQSQHITRDKILLQGMDEHTFWQHFQVHHHPASFPRLTSSQLVACFLAAICARLWLRASGTGCRQAASAVFTHMFPASPGGQVNCCLELWGGTALFNLKMEEAVFPPLPPSYPQGERRCCQLETSQARSPRHQDTVSTVRVISSPMSSFPFAEPPPWLCLSRSGCFLTEKAAQLLSESHFTHCTQHLGKGWCRSCLALPPVSCHCPQQAIGALSHQTKAHLPPPAPLSPHPAVKHLASGLASSPLPAKQATAAESPVLEDKVSVSARNSSLALTPVSPLLSLPLNSLLRSPSPPVIHHDETAKQMRQGFNNVYVPSLYVLNA